MISAVTLTGCATRLTGSVDVLNQRIAYLDWNNSDCWSPDNPADARNCKLKVKAGMRIRLDSIALPSGGNKVEQQTLPASYTYTVPDVDKAVVDGLVLGRENAFFMTTLLSMSEQGRKVGSAIWQLMYGKDSDSYASRVTDPDSYAAKILKPFLENMIVDYQFLEKSDIKERTTSQLAKRAFCSTEGQDHLLKDKPELKDIPSRSLQVTLPPRENGGDDAPVIILGSDDWFYARTINTIEKNRFNEFMEKEPARTRTNIELSIAVRLDSEEGVRYVPPCTTITDIEHMFGIEIVGLWREQSNLVMKGKEGDITAGGLITLGWNNKSTVNPDGYYSIELRPGAEAAPGGTLIDGSELCGKKNPCLERVLLAHGDVLLVGRRKHVLGSFWQQ